MGSYFTDRYNRVKLGCVVSKWQRVTRGCPHGSGFGPLIWNIFQNDLTYTVEANMNIYMQMTTFFMPLAAPSLMCMMILLFVLSQHLHGTELIY